jgi:hypothetical protein
LGHTFRAKAAHAFCAGLRGERRAGGLGSAHLAGGPLQSTASPPALRPRPTRRNRTVRSRGGIGTAGDTFLLQLRGLAAPVSAASARLALSASRPETEPLERIAATYGGHGVLYSPRSVDICDLDCVCSALLHVDKRGATATTNARAQDPFRYCAYPDPCRAASRPCRVPACRGPARWRSARGRWR